ncbi:pyruvate dehydrogenase phosphatase regulatory subunit, mitochondrial-like isoform X3 [Littorina saxatilis]|uniref:pyruvate dehydrogenase phosphatase regulatory subunit, mitochondrial-like isoform X3 n=1 Tax=Littorina saxatilis TaxID=31220 RepID=UPI0038B4EB78
MSWFPLNRAMGTAGVKCLKITSPSIFSRRILPSTFRAAAPGYVKTRLFSTAEGDSPSPEPVSLATPPKPLPQQARVVVCGGGVVGLSVAYHLAERGWTDVVVLEQGKVTCGTTWHSVGLVSTMKATRTDMAMTRYSADLYKQWEAEGEGVGWKQCGSLNVARTLDRMIHLKRQHAVAKTMGVESQVVTPAEIQDICPVLRVDDLQGGLWIPGDGALTAPDVAMVFSRKAKAKGVQVIEDVGVEKVITENGRVSKVVTSAGNIKCEYFVNSAGLWSRELGKRTDPRRVNVPLHACEHYYLVTKPITGTNPLMPVIRDYDGYVYFREWNGGLLGGGFEPSPKPCFHQGPPDKFEFQLLQEDWDHFQVLLTEILHRVPAMETAEIRQLVNGPESFTPDSRWLLGETAEVANYFVATGMNSSGIAGAGGVGKQVADWIIDGRPSLNMWAYDIRRFIGHHNNKRFLRDRMQESFPATAVLKYPREEYTTGRKLRCSPLHTRQEVAGAVFGETMAYERAMYFKLDDDDSPENEDRRMWTYTKPMWFEAAQEEYWACKERVCLMDMSSFAKFELELNLLKNSASEEVVDFLQKLCSNDIDVDIGTIVHTGMQNKYGGFENDTTIARLDHNHFYMICPATQQSRAWTWLARHMPQDGSVHLRDVTSMFSGINIIGPHAQQLLADVSDISTSRSDFRPMSCKKIDVGSASGVWAMRLTHTGEDGFILYIPSEYALHVYDILMSAGKDYGVRNAGYYALRHLRIENFFAYWGLDLDDRTTPMECGRGYRVKFDKGDFIGKAALEQQRDHGVNKRFVHFQLEDYDVNLDLWPWGGEPIYRNGRNAGLTTTCGFGFALDSMVCLGFVRDFDDKGVEQILKNSNDFVMKDAKYEIDIAGTRFPAKPSIYTPKQNVTYVDPSFIPAPQKV